MYTGLGEMPSAAESDSGGGGGPATGPGAEERSGHVGTASEDVEDLVEMSRDELREELRAHGLPVSGTKVGRAPRGMKLWPAPLM